jgi:SAM-dependent methyltransferase
MDLFERQWSSYRAIVNHNLMEHREVAAATEAVLEDWLQQRPKEAPPARMVDLGCGDLALLAPLLRRLPLSSYTGLDLARPVLTLAEQSLGPVPYPTQWLEGDLLAWALGGPSAPATPDEAIQTQRGALTEPLQHPEGDQGRDAVAETGAGSSTVDILHSAYAIHHLSDDQKATFLAAVRQRLSPGGVFVWGDVFRQPGEHREAHAQRYIQRVETTWHPLTPDQRRHVIDHLSRFDIPADRAAIQSVAEAAGWRWRWAWNGTHRSEAVAVLTPA